MTAPSARVHLTPEVLALFRAYVDRYPAWGSLHVVLEDGNLGDQDVCHCLDNAEAKGDTPGAELARLLLRMSRTQRGKLAVRNWGR